MQTVTAGFTAHFEGPEPALEFQVELMESSGFNFPEDVDVTVTASTTKNTYSGSGSVDDNFEAGNLADGQAAEPIKYLVLDQAVCTLDAGFCLGGDGAKYTPGWWSEVKSDATCSFTSAPEVVVEYDPAVEANRIRVSTTTAYSGVKLVNLQAFYDGDPGYTDLGDFDFGTGARVIADLATGATLKDITKIKVTVKSTKAASDYARLTEIEPVVERSLDTLGTLEGYCENIKVRKCSGSVSSYAPASPGFGVNEFSCQLSKVSGVTPAENQLLVVSAGFDGELLQQGVFIITEARPGPDAWNITARGVLSLAAYNPFPDSVFKDSKISEILERILSWVGISEEEITFTLAADTVWEWYITEHEHGDDVLSKAAEALGVAIYETEDGEVVVRNSYGASVLTIDDDLIADLDKSSPQEINYVIVHYGSIEEGQPDYVLSASAPLEASETKTFVFSYNKAPILDNNPPFIEAFIDEDGEDLTAPTIQEWSADAYSLTIKVVNNVATAGTVSIQMWGTPLDKNAGEAIYEATHSDSIKRRGIRPFEATIYTNSATRAKAYGDALLKYLRACGGMLRVTLNKPAPHLQLRDVVTVDSNEYDIDAVDYVISQMDLGEDDTVLVLIPGTAVI